MKTIIDEFLEGLPKWLENMEKMEQEHCIVCGLRPDMMKKLAEEIRELKEKAWKYDDLCK